MFCEIIFAGCVKYPIFNLPLQYRITKNRSRLLRTEPPAYLLRPGVHLFQRHLRRTITKSVYIAIISRLVGYFLNNARQIFPKRHIFVLRWVYPQCELKRNVNIFVPVPVKCVVDWYKYVRFALNVLHPVGK